MATANAVILRRRKKWVEALRSGEYKQAQGGLRDAKGGYCCLGVACDVYRKATKAGRWEREAFVTATDRCSGVLPKEVLDYFGFDAQDPYFKLKHGEVPASSLNDGYRVGASAARDRRKTFRGIATLIEQQYIKPLEK